jgi:hypothetical protein
MEKLSEYCFYYDNTNDKHYKVVSIEHCNKFGNYDINTLKIKECKLILFDTIIVAKDPENSKEYERVEVYEKIPIGRKKVFPYHLYKKLDTSGYIFDCKDLILYDKYWYKTIE